MTVSKCRIHSFHTYGLFVHFASMVLRSFVILENLLDLETVNLFLGVHGLYPSWK